MAIRSGPRTIGTAPPPVVKAGLRGPERRGLLGLLYWWAAFPLHHFVFRKMLEAIAHDALDIARKAT